MCVNDQAIRPPRTLGDLEVLSLGKKQMAQEQDRIDVASEQRCSTGMDGLPFMGTARDWSRRSLP